MEQEIDLRWKRMHTYANHCTAEQNIEQEQEKKGNCYFNNVIQILRGGINEIDALPGEYDKQSEREIDGRMRPRNKFCEMLQVISHTENIEHSDGRKTLYSISHSFFVVVFPFWFPSSRPLSCSSCLNTSQGVCLLSTHVL